MIKRLRVCLIAIVFSLLSSVSVSLSAESDQHELATYLSDSTIFYLSFSDIGKINTDFQEGPFGKFFESEEVQAFFKPLIESDEFKPLFDLYNDDSNNDDWKKLEKFFSGDIALAVSMPDEFEDGEDPSVALIAECSGADDSLDELLGHSTKKDEPGSHTVNLFEEEFLGAVLRVKEKVNKEGVAEQDGWTVVDGVYVYAQPLDYLKEIVSQLKSPDESSSLLSSENYMEAIDYAGSGDTFVYFNCERTIALLGDAFKEGMQQGMGPQGNPMMTGVTAEGIFSALGLDALRSLVFSLDMNKDNPGMKGGLFYSEKRGLLELIAYESGEMPRVNFVPTDVLSSSISLFDFAGAWTALEKIVFNISPQMGELFLLQMDGYKAQTGLDFRENVVNNFGKTLVMATLPSEDVSSALDDPVDQLFAVSIKDPQAFSNYIEAVKDLLMPTADPFETREYQGETIYALKSEMNRGGKQISYAVTDDYLFFNTGSPALLEHALTTHKGSSADSGLWESEPAEEMLSMLPHDASEYSYSNMESLMLVVFGVFAELQKSMDVKQGDGFRFCEPASLPTTAGFPHVLIAATYVRENSILFESVVLDKDIME